MSSSGKEFQTVGPARKLLNLMAYYPHPSYHQYHNHSHLLLLRNVYWTGNAEFAGVDNAGVLMQARQVEMWYQLTVVGLFVANLDSTVTMMCAHTQHSGKKSV